MHCMILGEIATIKKIIECKKIMKVQTQHEFLQQAEIKCVHCSIAILWEIATL